MAENPTDRENVAAALAAQLARSSELQALHLQAMESLRQAVVEAGEEGLKLHRKTLRALDATRADLERMKRTLRSLAAAR